MNVWKVGSRWSESGNPNTSILDLFRRYKVVFVGCFKERMFKIQEGEIIAISDGLRIVAVGRVLGVPSTLEELRIDFTKEDLKRFCHPSEPIPSDVVGCRIDFHDLDESDRLDCRQGTIHRVYLHKEKIEALYRKYRKLLDLQGGFKIKARTCTLIGSGNAGDDWNTSEGLLESNLRFTVPIYQRTYSWEEAQIHRLLEDLVKSFGNGEELQREPMFIGTMQLTARNQLDERYEQQEVIDGQQRLSTLVLILKWLWITGVRDTRVARLWKDEWFETRVSGGEQQKYLEAALRLEAMPEQGTLNPYFRALHLIAAFFAKVEGESPIDKAAFCGYLLTQLHFVVIETRASISKTLKIFDTINSSGLDLNGSDLFKVRFYEYLSQKDSSADKDRLFKEINSLYQDIDQRNREAKRVVCTMGDILSLLQHDMIARHDLDKGLHSFGYETFFERFFDTVQNLNKWDGFNRDKIQGVTLDIAWVRSLITKRYLWTQRNERLKHSPEALVALKLISWSRYSRYRYLPILMLKEDGSNFEEVGKLTILLARLFVIYSVKFAKVVNEIHTFIQNHMQVFLAGEQWDLIEQKCAESRPDLEKRLNTDPLAYMAKAKNLVCRLAACLDQGFASSENVFSEPIDIEHIEPATLENEAGRAERDALWGDEINRLGNLIILEASLNRSIKNVAHAEKLVQYRESKFESVKRFAMAHEVWSLDSCKKRKQEAIEKLSRYLCGAPT